MAKSPKVEGVDQGAPAAEPVATEAPKAKKLVVAPGCAITSKVGILGSGREVTADLFVQGDAVIKARLLSGHIVEVEA